MAAHAHPTTLTVTHADLVKLGGVIFISIVIPFVLYLLQNAYQNYRARLDRRRQLYAEAFSACMEYKEFVYVIYRRGKSNPEAERLRISEALRDVQKRMAYHQAWLETESSAVAQAYDKLVKRLREIAGSEMKTAWKTPAITEDKQMIIENHIDWKDLATHERHYIKVVNRKLTPWWFFWQRYKSL